MELFFHYKYFLLHLMVWAARSIERDIHLLCELTYGPHMLCVTTILIQQETDGLIIQFGFWLISDLIWDILTKLITT